MRIHRLYVLLLLSITLFLGSVFAFNKDRDFSFGLDLLGGSQLTYSIDTSEVVKEEVTDRVTILKKVIERRVNSLGIAETNVFSKKITQFGGNDDLYFLIIEIPGVLDVQEAINRIGETPFLEFKLLRAGESEFIDIGLNGGHINSASVSFLTGAGGHVTNEPVVILNFNGGGKNIFAELTKNNVGNQLAVFLDGNLVSIPVIKDAILGGTTQISGGFTLQEAKTLSSNLNTGALPLDINFESSKTISSNLGSEAIDNSVYAAIFTFIFIILFMIIVYRGVGVLASLSLLVYAVITISLWKILGIVLTSAGIAGFIMSIGFAVDANILIFERIREELKNGKSFKEATEKGFTLAWCAIRDGNTSSLIVAVILFYFGTSIVKGFAFTFSIGVIVSMLTTYTFSKYLLKILSHYLPDTKNPLIIKK